MNVLCVSEKFDGSIVKHVQLAKFSLTEVIYPPGYRVSRCHPISFICFAVAGEFTESYGSCSRICDSSTMVYHPREHEHSVLFHARGGQLLFIELESEWLDRLSQNPSHLEAPIQVSGGICGWHAIRLYREFHRNDGVSPLAVEGMILELMSELLREGGARATGETGPRWLLDARELIHARFLEPLTLSAVASAVGIHPVYLATKFRFRYGCGVGEYVRRLRIDFSREELRKDIPLSEIAASAGFADQAHFSRTFKRLTGMTPMSYRKETSLP